MTIKGKTALVTGSTSGIGLGIASRLAAEGANIVLNGFGGAAEIERLRAQLAAAHGVSVIYDGADMTKPAAIAAMVGKAIAQFGAVDILVNNAGIQHVAPVDEFPLDKWDAIIAINLSSSFHTVRAALPAMRRGAGAASSTSPRRTPWWRARSSRRTWRRSTALPASPRPWRWRSPSEASR